MNIYLTEMTRELARQYFRHFRLDPALFADPEKYQPYVYNEAECDATVERYRKMGRIYLAVMLENEPVGEVVLKNIDHALGHCTLGINMRSDEFKNRGYGTTSELLALQHAFEKLSMKTVFADTLIGNKRSQHVLKKVGFVETHRDNTFVYYRCNRDSWTAPTSLD